VARIRAFKKTNFQENEPAKLQSNLEIFFKPLLNSEIIDGILLKDVILTTGSVNKVEHKLGRKLLGWMVIGKNANATVWDSQATNTTLDSTIDLNSSANVTVNLWVF